MRCQRQAAHPRAVSPVRSLLTRALVEDDMCTIFGVRRFPGQKVDEAFLRVQSTRTARYALDGTYLSAFEEIGMGCQPYHKRNALGWVPSP